MDYINTVTLKIDGIEYGTETDSDGNLKNVHEIVASHDRNVISLEVGIHGRYDNNDFDIVSSADDNWIEIKRMRNIVDIVTSPNNYYDRSTSVIFQYRLNPAISFTLSISQEQPDYSVKVCECAANGDYDEETIMTDNLTFEFPTLLNDDDVNSVTKYIHVECSNGKPYVSNIKQYTIISEDRIDDGYVNVKYDNGLGVVLYGDTCKITYHGKANLYHRSRYEIHIRNKFDIYKQSVVVVDESSLQSQ